MFEKRKYQRILTRVPAECHPKDVPHKAFPVQIINIGAEGICFTSEWQPSVEQKLTLKFTLPDKNIVTMTAEVMWQEKSSHFGKYDAGVKIIGISSENEGAWIQHYCQKLFILTQEKKKILVVDDEKSTVRLLKIELESDGYEVICAEDGEEGYLKYVKECPDLIVLDVMMPKLNGYEVCRKIRRVKGDEKTPILMLTAKVEDGDRIQGRVLGANVYISKPFESENLLSSIRRLLSRNKAQD